jgi:multidrug efflux system membrane fusion protein
MRVGALPPFAVLGMLLLAAGCSSEAGGDAQGRQATQAPVPVRVALVTRQDVPLQLRAIGNVEPFSSVSVRAQIEGQLAQVHFQEGQEVKQGALLFTIDPRPFEAALRQAEANLARDQAEASNAAVEATRRARLLEQGFVSRDEHDAAQTRAASLRATVKATEAAIENERLQLQYCYIRSPIDGRLGQLLVHEGNIVKANDTTLAVVNQLRPVHVVFSVPEQELPAIRERASAEGLTVHVTVRGGSGGPIAGTLTFIDNTVNTSTGTVLLKGLFANDDEVLWPGQFVDVSLVLSIDRQAVVTPAEAIQTGQKGPFTFVVTPAHTVEVRPVVVGRTAGPVTVVAEGLAAGEQVVTDGHVRLAPGSKVEILEAPAAPAPAGASEAGA